MKVRDKRQLWKLERLIKKNNLIAHAFIVVEEDIKDLELSSYVEVTSCKDVAQWQ